MKSLLSIVLLVYFSLALAAQNSKSKTLIFDLETAFGSYNSNCALKDYVTISLPAGESYEVIGIDIAYTFQSVSPSTPAAQRSLVKVSSIGLLNSESQLYQSVNGTAGAAELYARTNVAIANGVYPGGQSFDFTLEAFRVTGTDMLCGDDQQFVPEGTFAVTMYYTDEIVVPKVGVNTPTPHQVMDVNGKIRVGDDYAIPTAGTIRFDDSSKEFQGWDGDRWVSFGDTNGWGETLPQSVPAESITKTGVYDFGASICKISDTMIAVGGTNGSALGKVVIYKKVEGLWNELLTLDSPSIQNGELFGFSLEATPTILFVGAPYYNGTLGIAEGAVYMYSISGDNFTLEQTITTNEGDDNNLFGSALEFYNNKLFVGAPFHNDEGAVMIFDIDLVLFDATEASTFLVASDGEEYDYFGSQISVNLHDIVVSAPYEDYYNGKVYVFKHGTYSEKQVIAGNNTEGLGISLYSDSDHLLVGATLGFDQGSVKQYTRVAGNWALSTTITPSSPESDEFGYSLSKFGEYLVIGARRSDGLQDDNTGLAELFKLNGSNYNYQRTLHGANLSANDYMGTAVQILEDDIFVSALGLGTGTVFRFPKH